ncbi:NAD(P)/FAD-dependent oxidoreductase [Lichenifustis flavocetrariae]|uniref:FAD-binding oxidoreductase n=1 Tax=Lichenifustis flavocetrariae TaxID=2949735 RepID=A0AA42CME5_9HYPH|nr:FAD-binding oxidoreductase [Lichenifustis flavocetrariae]MCW6511491.1 FAD-binding oxidoreductase [Lichenifustis flavocetrariae]
MSATPHSVVIGAGIIGLSCARALLREGHAVTVIDRDPAGDKASFGNAGGLGITEILPASSPGLIWQIPKWLADPLGPLSLRPAHLPSLMPWLVRFLRTGTKAEVARIASVMAGLLAPVYDDMLPLLAELGLSRDLHRVGALWIYDTEAGFERDAPAHALRRRHGIEVETISAAEARRLEPALAPTSARAVVTPQWSHLSDPKRIVDRLREALMAGGVVMRMLDATAIDGQAVVTAQGERIAFDHLIVATGAWSGRIARLIGDPVLIESERGYNATLPSPGVTLSREVIFAQRQFVATPLEIGLRIGGAAEFAGLDAKPDYRRSDALVTLARRYLPGLDTRGAVRWMGNRPTTPDSLPVIGRSPRRRDVVYAFGHGHVGLTLGPTTGRLVADIVTGRTAPVDLSPFSIARFA